MVDRNDPVVIATGASKKFYSADRERDDIIAAGVLRIMEKKHMFDPSRASWGTFCYMLAYQGMKQYVDRKCNKVMRRTKKIGDVRITIEAPFLSNPRDRKRKSEHLMSRDEKVAETTLVRRDRYEDYPDAKLIDKELYDIIIKKAERILTERQLTIFKMHYIGGKGWKEIADILNVNKQACQQVGGKDAIKAIRKALPHEWFIK